MQILHTIDDVLNPLIISSKFSPNAYDFLSSSFKWNLPGGISLSKYFVKIQEHKLQRYFKDADAGVGHTFFVPIDSGVDAHHFRRLDGHSIRAHVVPFYVLFTRPTKKNFAYETLANDSFAYMVVSIVEIDGKLFVKGTNNGRGYKRQEFFAEIIVDNIPVKNGVVHLISKPLMEEADKSLGAFPYLPIMTKISGDPELQVFYEMGERTKFNKIFDMEGSWNISS